MNNLQRLEMEIKGIELSQEESIVYLSENGLVAHDEYNASSLTARRSIYQTALAALQSIANDPNLMKNIKQDDVTITEFHENISRRINQLTRSIRSMKTDVSSSDVFMLFK